MKIYFDINKLKKTHTWDYSIESEKNKNIIINFLNIKGFYYVKDVYLSDRYYSNEIRFRKFIKIIMQDE